MQNKSIPNQSMHQQVDIYYCNRPQKNEHQTIEDQLPLTPCFNAVSIV
jgi:hypothetical protein